MPEKMESLHKNGTWDMVRLPKREESHSVQMGFQEETRHTRS